MNREIKFRVFDQVSKKIYPVKSIWGFPEVENVCVPFKDTVGTLFHSFELMQFTGLKDKNGVDIYEGDILSNEFNAIGNVSFKNGMFVVDFKYDETILTKDNYTGCFRLYVVNMITKVISNIHENPELLC